MLRPALSAKARRLRLFGALVLASCSTLVGIEDPVPRPGCEGDACEAGSGGALTGGKAPVGTAGSPADPTGGIGGDGETPKVEAGSGGTPDPMVGGSGGDGGASPDPECEENDVRCDIYQPQRCEVGQWKNDREECAHACVDGECHEPTTCGASATPTPCVDGASCCETIWISGGDYLMGAGDDDDDVSYKRVVSGFYLDRFEVTVGRFRAFQGNYKLPAEGDGEHPKFPGSGWHKAWEQLVHPFANDRTIVPQDLDDLVVQLTDDCGDEGTWAEGTTLRPINCVNWYVAFAFCVYDGGRLPTEAEWNYAAAFGDSQRPYPWSTLPTDTVITSEHATFYDFPNEPPPLPTPVGSHAAGRGGFQRLLNRGHDDLAGNLTEWTLDQWLDAPPDECTEDCFTSWPDGVEDRVVRGGAYQSPFAELRVGSRTSAPASTIGSYWGFRCARDIDTSPVE